MLAAASKALRSKDLTRSDSLGRALCVDGRGSLQVSPTCCLLDWHTPDSTPPGPARRNARGVSSCARREIWLERAGLRRRCGGIGCTRAMVRPQRRAGQATSPGDGRRGFPAWVTRLPRGRKKKREKNARHERRGSHPQSSCSSRLSIYPWLRPYLLVSGRSRKAAKRTGSTQNPPRTRCVPCPAPRKPGSRSSWEKEAGLRREDRKREERRDKDSGRQ